MQCPKKEKNFCLDVILYGLRAFPKRKNTSLTLIQERGGYCEPKLLNLPDLMGSLFTGIGKLFYKGTTPVDDGNFEKVLDILVEHPQLVQNLNELADELRTFYSKLTCKLQYFMRLGDIDFMFLINFRGDSIVAKAVALYF